MLQGQKMQRALNTLDSITRIDDFGHKRNMIKNTGFQCFDAKQQIFKSHRKLICM